MFRTWCNRSDLPDLSFAHLSIHYVSREAAIVGMIVVNMTRSSFLLLTLQQCQLHNNSGHPDSFLIHSRIIPVALRTSKPLWYGSRMRIGCFVRPGYRAIYSFYTLRIKRALWE